MANTRKDIRERITGDIDPTFAVDEGTFFYENADSVAIELESAYQTQENNENQKFMVDITDLAEARKQGQDFGVPYDEGTFASGSVTLTGPAGTVFNVGDLVASETREYACTQQVSIPTGQTTVVANVRCTTIGTSGNAIIGAIRFFPVTLGFSAVTNAVAFDNGTDPQTLEEYKSDYFDRVRANVTSGNEDYYQVLAQEVSGVGSAKVFPLENGPGTATITIINADGQPANQALMDSVLDAVNANRIIGLNPTVDTATTLDVNIVGDITLAQGYNIPQVIGFLNPRLDSYFESINFKGDPDTVDYFDLADIVRQTDGINDLNNFTVNGGTGNIALSNKQIATRGTVTLS